jgi:hypothetical protein
MASTINLIIISAFIAWFSAGCWIGIWIGKTIARADRDAGE